MATDIIAFDDAVKVAVDFAVEDGETLVLAMPDHNCGGLKIGNYLHEYVERSVEFVREPLLNMKMTVDGVIAKMGVPPNEATADDLKKSVAENWGIELTEEELKMVLEYSNTFSGVYESSPVQPLPLSYGLSRIVSERYTIAGWTSHGHTGENGKFLVHAMFLHHLCGSRLKLKLVCNDSSDMGVRHGSPQTYD
jgi:alkaline phosphatase